MQLRVQNLNNKKSRNEKKKEKQLETRNENTNKSSFHPKDQN